MNMFKTGLLMAALTILLVLVGGIIGGETGLVFAFALAVVFNFGAYWFSDKIVLSMHRAQEVSRSQASELYGRAHFFVGGGSDTTTQIW
jgi:heat shock protein HtpX